MSLYDKMGLLITPNGVAPGKIFAYKPTNGSGDGVFDRNTTATRVNSAGLIEDVAIDMARIDYPTNGSCPHLLFESQSTNLVTYSEGFSQWATIQNVTVIDNNAISPNGTLNASKITETTSNSVHRLFQNSTVSNNRHTFSVFAKKGTRDWIYLRLDGNGASRTWFDLDNGIIGTVDSDHIAEIKDFGNGWYRCTVTIKGNVFDTTPLGIIAITTSDNVQVYAGDTSKYIYVYGAQLEQLPYATSYIPTNGSAVTRVQDVATDFGDVNSFNSEEGVLFVEMAALHDSSFNRWLSISDGGFSNYIQVYFRDNGRIIFNIITNGVIQNNFVYSLITSGKLVTDMNKYAFKWKENDLALWVNGVEVLTDLVANVPNPNTFNKFSFSAPTDSNVTLSKVKQVQVYKEALTDLELEYLTTYATFPDLANANNYNLILNT